MYIRSIWPEARFDGWANFGNVVLGNGMPDAVAATANQRSIKWNVECTTAAEISVDTLSIKRVLCSSIRRQTPFSHLVPHSEYQVDHYKFNTSYMVLVSGEPLGNCIKCNIGNKMYHLGWVNAGIRIRTALVMQSLLAVTKVTEGGHTNGHHLPRRRWWIG